MRPDGVAAVRPARVGFEGSAQNLEVLGCHQQIFADSVSGQAPLVNAVATKLADFNSI